MIQVALPRNFNEQLIRPALKWRSSDEIAYHKQHIQPVFVNRALTKLKQINSFCSDLVVHNSLVDVSEQSDPLLTNNYAGGSDMEYETDSDEEIEGKNYAKQNEQGVDGPNIYPNQIVAVV